ncbi:hypothetical protein BCR39DRAFT_540825 [Naematelia encephala]|uniref:Uncharacterized protein n=1 Tax=Naematelia encephala TaxID=71784 RepID=A0A1Y2AV36_9TREE|nr:hypothetical protein BCR39DRAFT_540825 [Naematelia encephala]
MSSQDSSWSIKWEEFISTTDDLRDAPNPNTERDVFGLPTFNLAHNMLPSTTHSYTTSPNTTIHDPTETKEDRYHLYADSPLHSRAIAPIRGPVSPQSFPSLGGGESSSRPASPQETWLRGPQSRSGQSSRVSKLSYHRPNWNLVEPGPSSSYQAQHPSDFQSQKNHPVSPFPEIPLPSAPLGQAQFCYRSNDLLSATNISQHEPGGLNQTSWPQAHSSTDHPTLNTDTNTLHPDPTGPRKRVSNATNPDNQFHYHPYRRSGSGNPGRACRTSTLFPTSEHPQAQQHELPPQSGIFNPTHSNWTAARERNSPFQLSDDTNNWSDNPPHSHYQHNRPLPNNPSLGNEFASYQPMATKFQAPLTLPPESVLDARAAVSSHRAERTANLPRTRDSYGQTISSVIPGLQEDLQSNPNPALFLSPSQPSLGRAQSPPSQPLFPNDAMLPSVPTSSPYPNSISPSHKPVNQTRAGKNLQSPFTRIPLTSSVPSTAQTGLIGGSSAPNSSKHETIRISPAPDPCEPVSSPQITPAGSSYSAFDGQSNLSQTDEGVCVTVVTPGIGSFVNHDGTNAPVVTRKRILELVLRALGCNTEGQQSEVRCISHSNIVGSHCMREYILPNGTGVLTCETKGCAENMWSIEYKSAVLALKTRKLNESQRHRIHKQAQRVRWTETERRGYHHTFVYTLPTEARAVELISQTTISEPSSASAKAGGSTRPQTRKGKGKEVSDTID